MNFRVKIDSRLLDLVNKYNHYCKKKYKRPYWRDLTLMEIVTHQSLSNALLKQGQHFGLSSNESFKMNIIFQQMRAKLKKKPRKLNSISEGEIEVIVNELLDGNLVVIPNSKIYVLFGVLAEGYNTKADKKINEEKLRHPNLPVARLGSNNFSEFERIHNSNTKEFLKELVKTKRPIGILISKSSETKKSNLYIYYPGEFFVELEDRISNTVGGKYEILVSSGNLTTAGANTTAEGICQDFAFGRHVSGVIDKGDLKKNSEGNNSTTIISCTETGGLSFYRLGYPRREEVEAIANNSGVTVEYIKGTRHTLVI